MAQNKKSHRTYSNCLTAPSHYLNQYWLIISEVLWHISLYRVCSRYLYLVWVLKSLISGDNDLTHWGRVTHICVSKITIIGSDNGFSPGRCQAIIWTSVGILLIGPLGTNFSEILIEIYTFSFKKRHVKMSSGKWWPFCLGLNVLNRQMCGQSDGHMGMSKKFHKIIW